MTTTDRKPLRSERVGSKLFVGYVPCTALAVLAVVVAVSASRSWAALLAGGVLITVWSIQIALTNLAILLLRFQRWFFAKALAMSIVSALVMPVAAIAHNQAKWLLIGRPDVSVHLEKISAGQCKLAALDAMRRDELWTYGYEVNARVRCKNDAQDRRCKWFFWYPSNGSGWAVSPPAGNTAAQSLSWACSGK